MLNNTTHLTLVSSPVRHIKAKAEVLNNGTLAFSLTDSDKIKSFKVERTGTGKFFGYGYTQKTNLKLIDKDRETNLTTSNAFKLFLGNSDLISNFPTFYVTEVHRDENTNELSVTAYDLIEKATKHTINECGLMSYSLYEITSKMAEILGCKGLNIIGVHDNVFNTEYSEGANIEGTETFREVLDAVGEVTQCIYYIDNNDYLVFKRLDVPGQPIFTIDKEKYFALSSKTNRRLTSIAHITELGDNLSVSLSESGTTHYIRENPFYTLRNDTDVLLDNALSAIGGLTINQFECDWRGNYLLEIGDKIGLTTKDDDVVYSYVLDDTIEYDGTLSQKTKWEYLDTEETETTPTTIGERIKQTYAKVDKANKEITLVVSDVEKTKDQISDLETNQNENNENTSQELEQIKSSITEIKQTAEEIKIEISKGTSQVNTKTGFRFDDEGLNVSKSDSEMSTLITEDGMKVSKSGDVVLTANNQGVDAKNLRATTFLIIGNNSRLEDYKTNRTACFWIGD